VASNNAAALTEAMNAQYILYAMAHTHRWLEHDPEKCDAVFPRDKRGTRLRGDHAQTKS